MITPMQLLKLGEQLKGRVSAGVDCEDCPKDAPKSASGWCITCGVCLCDDHDMEHLMQNPCKPKERDLSKVLTLAEKVEMIKKHLEKERAESPDGMTSWDRVEKHRIEKGHLPQGNYYCEICEGKRSDAVTNSEDMEP